MEVHDMSDELFEVTFSGQIREGENYEDVKARVGKMFNADEAKIAQLFSGNRVVIKKNVDQQTAAKYETALNRAGAECEVKSMSPPPAETPTAAASTSGRVSDVDYGDIAPPPKTDPLGISGDEIEDLSVSIAPVGSALQDNIKQVEAPQIDISELAVAPVGSDLGVGKKQADPPPPDTAGLSMSED